MKFALKIANEQWLTDAMLAGSEVFPKPETIYGQGLWRCKYELIADAEKQIGYSLPAELKEFYYEYGVGRIVGYEHTPYNSPNNILIPTHIPKLINGTCGWMMPYTQIEPNTLPFFERDVDLFLCLKPHSDNPNAVWWMWGGEMHNGGKICDSLVEFFEKLIIDPDWFNPPQKLPE